MRIKNFEFRISNEEFGATTVRFGDSEFEIRLRDLIRRVEAWSYADSDAETRPDIAREIALGLRSLGIGTGDIVAVFSETSADFYLVDLGGVDLSGANLSRAILRSANMGDTKQTGTVFTGAMMPDNTIHP